MFVFTAVLLMLLAQDPSWEVAEHERVVVENFVLFEHGEIWHSEREMLGTASMRVSTTVSAEKLVNEVELLLNFTPNETHVQRALRRSSTGQTIISREWRAGSDKQARAGRTSVLERGPRLESLRTWAGAAMRVELSPSGESILALIDRGRASRGFTVESTSLFEPFEVRSVPVLRLQFPLMWGIPGTPRVMSVIPLDGSIRPSHWVFMGRELLAFVEGGVQAVRHPTPVVEQLAVR